MPTAVTTRAEVLSFLRRDWALSRRVKDDGTARWVRANGTAAALRLAQMLLDQVWPKLKREKRSMQGLIAYREKMNRAAAARR